MQFKEAVPKDASAVILIKNGKVFLAQRNPKISFLGGWYAFPGGKVDAEDSNIEVQNCADEDSKKFIVAAVRETFEEVGVLLVRGGDRITKGQRASLHDDLISGRFSFAEILENWGLRIDAEDFRDTGFWTTPNFSPVRFKTKFLLAECPRKQEPQVFGEFTTGEFISPQDALKKWEKGNILISPPVFLTLQSLADIEEQTKENFNKNSASLNLCIEKLSNQSQRQNGEIRHLKINPFITIFPVLTETLPPATHTNCFIAGEKEFVVIDAASPFADEQKALHEFIDSLIEKGNKIKSLIVTHLHRDHYLGVNDLQKHLKEKFDLDVPIAAHRLTAESLKDEIKVEKFIEDEEIIEPETANEIFKLRALHLPGHARGHLCFYDERRGFLLSSDNVIGTGSVLIHAPEGNMSDYLNSLEKMKNLPNLRFLCGSHGAAISDAKGKIESCIEHRLERERKILEALENGAKDVKEIVREVYKDVPESLHKLAELSVAAHLEKIYNDKNNSTEV